jgi:hypothetical protein
MERDGEGLGSRSRRLPRHCGFAALLDSILKKFAGHFGHFKQQKRLKLGVTTNTLKLDRFIPDPPPLPAKEAAVSDERLGVRRRGENERTSYSCIPPCQSCRRGYNHICLETQNTKQE